MRLCSYVIKHDAGFAPNPFMGCCTLATCKPTVRKNARLGDWIMATGSKDSGAHGRLIFLMRVQEILQFDCYDQDSRYQAKKPKLGGTREEMCGDNIYFKDALGKWHQRPNPHHDKTGMEKDLSGEKVLIGKTFFYFGANALIIPPEYKQLVRTTQGHQYDFEQAVSNGFVEWVSKQASPGVHGRPAGWERAANLVQIGLPRLRSKEPSS